MGFQDNIVITKSLLCDNNKKNHEEKKPEETIFQAILDYQIIKKNSKIYS